MKFKKHLKMRFYHLRLKLTPTADIYKNKKCGHCKKCQKLRGPRPPSVALNILTYQSASVPWGGGLYCTALFSPHNNFFKEEIITYTKEAELKDYFSHADRSVVCFCIIFVLVFPAVLLS